jgi:hypothetical protein
LTPDGTRPSRARDWRIAAARVRSNYLVCHGREARLFGGGRFTEKMQWRKLFDLDPLYRMLSDKLAARGYVSQRLGRDASVPLLWHGDDPDAIPFDALAPPYVIKSTHASGHVILVGADVPPDRAAIRETCRAWLAHCHGTAADEPGYVHVPRRLVAERQVFGPDGGRPFERRVFVFGGRPRVINTVFVEAGRVRNGAFHAPDWTRLPWHLRRALPDMAFPRPALLDEMLETAARLGAGLDHVRVDLFDGGDRFWVGELTLYSWSGYEPLHPDEADLELGAMWRQRFRRLRALRRVLLDRREIRPAGTARS